ncbi:MAG TPA: preprotein translocase subunit YajC, partial [Phycisphaerales bacterium]|nr:preprotein translocase subunit YajC [Phycisphaerales bacterium]
MNDWNWTVFILAQEGAAEVLGAPSGGTLTGEASGQPAGPGAPTGGQGAPPANPFGMLFPLIIGLLIFMMITSMFSGRKEKKKRAEMLAAIKKRDKVQTAGGIIGTVIETQGDEIVIKTEGTKMRFSRAAIQRVLKSARGPGDDRGDGIEEMDLENESYDDAAE